MDFIFTVVCLAVAVYDGLTRRIPNFTVVAVLLLKVLSLVLNFNAITLFDSLFAALFGAVVFFLPKLLKKDIGFGDIKFAIATAFYLGFANFVYAMAIGMFSAILFLLILIFAKKKDIKNTQIPLGIFMSVGSVIVVVSDFFI